jgi:hypothetical protein
MSPQPCFVGLDVAQATLDIAVRPTAEPWQVNNDAPGMTTPVPQRQALAPTLIVLEASRRLSEPHDGRPGHRRPPGRRGQRAPGAGVCPGGGPPGQDRAY